MGANRTRGVPLRALYEGPTCLYAHNKEGLELQAHLSQLLQEILVSVPHAQ